MIKSKILEGMGHVKHHHSAGTGTVWLEGNHVKTLLDQMDWEGEIREVNCSLTFVKEMDLLLVTYCLKSLREGCTLGKHQEIKMDISWTKYL
jgi:hypothetical protein